MSDLILLPEAVAELDALYETDEDAAALIDVLLESLWDDSDTLELLCRPRNHFTHEPPFECKRYGAMQSIGKNIYTIKVRDLAGALLPYRVLIGFHAQIDAYYVLAIANRKNAYDTNDQLFQTVLERYGRAGIPDYPT